MRASVVKRLEVAERTTAARAAVQLKAEASARTANISRAELNAYMNELMATEEG